MTTQLLLLGTGSPNLEPDKFQSAWSVIVDDRSYLVDCGGGMLQRVSQAHHRYEFEALAMPNLTRLFLTHLHPDHTTGLADLIIATWVQERTEPLIIYGPKGTQSLVDHLLIAYQIGISEHRDGLAPIYQPLLVEVHEIEIGEVYSDAQVEVEAFRVQHGNLDAFGYKFITSDKTIVFSGDTSPTPRLIEQATNCDILVHEVYSEAYFKSRPLEWQRYHAAVHTSTVELAEIANKAQPKLLIVTHQLYWGATDESILAEIQEVYDGVVVAGHDLDLF